MQAVQHAQSRSIPDHSCVESGKLAASTRQSPSSHFCTFSTSLEHSSRYAKVCAACRRPRIITATPKQTTAKHSHHCLAVAKSSSYSGLIRTPLLNEWNDWDFSFTPPQVLMETPRTEFPSQWVLSCRQQVRFYTIRQPLTPTSLVG